VADLLRERVQSSLGAAYTLERELHGGGMSRVFLARDTALERDVVIKVLVSELAEGLSAERFAREIRLAAALQEPHIVPLLSAGTTSEGLPYYTMPYVRGQSLRQRMSQGPVPLATAVSILRDVAHALAYAHANLDSDTEEYSEFANLAAELPLFGGQIASRAGALLVGAGGGSLDFDADIRPWFGGEVAVAVLGGSADPETVELIEVADAEGADEFASSLDSGDVDAERGLSAAG
jgi:aminoglycoside phosphotransferase (APT) family kinase protein